jgi:hypothetical protein
MMPIGNDSESVPFTWDILTYPWVQVYVKSSPIDYTYSLAISFKFTPAVSTSYDLNNNSLYIDINWWPRQSHKMTLIDGTTSDWDYNYYYSYLPLRERKLTDIWEYYWMKW